MRKPQIKVFVGMDMAKGDHYAQAITADGEELFARPVPNDQAAIGRCSQTQPLVVRWQ